MYDFLYSYGSLKIKTRKCLKCHSVLEKDYKNVITWFHFFFLSFHRGEVHFHFIFITKSNSCGFGTCVEQIKWKKKKKRR